MPGFLSRTYDSALFSNSSREKEVRKHVPSQQHRDSVKRQILRFCSEPYREKCWLLGVGRRANDVITDIMFKYSNKLDHCFKGTSGFYVIT